MSSFTETPLVYLMPKHHLKVVKAFSYYYKEKDGERLEIPEGFISDGATVPRILWCFFPPISEYAYAAILHDYMYDNAIKTKKEADKVLYHAMRILGYPKWKAKLFYYCVRVFGRGDY